MKKDIKKEYVNGDLTIVWQPAKCIHAAVCVKTLPEVYDPKGKPWIKAENASIDALKAQIEKCPSGALSYYMKGEANQESITTETKVEVLENGPLLVYGTLQVKDKEGNLETKNKRTAFCRCGHPDKKPYCDGMHRKVEFKG
jgi:uncharacterized Fe-S cluster protein YjdI